jgi:hypothetical protein
VESRWCASNKRRAASRKRVNPHTLIAVGYFLPPLSFI